MELAYIYIYLKCKLHMTIEREWKNILIF